MTQMTTADSESFVDRRTHGATGGHISVERRQFSNSYQELSPEAKEIALAVDEYKLMHRRRFISYEELASVIRRLGYAKS